MTSLSIIIPWRGGGEACEDTLVSVLQNRPHDCEIVVVHAGAYDDPYDLAEEVTFIAAPVDCNLIEQINVGFRHSQAEVAHLVQPGLEVEDGWTEPALAHFQDAAVAAVTPLVVDGRSERIVTAGVRRRLSGARQTVLAGARPVPRKLRRARSCGPDLLTGFWRRSAWEQAGGFDPAFRERLADVDMALALEECGFAAVLESECRLVKTTGERPSMSPWMEGRLTERLFWKHLPQRGWRRAVALHGLGLLAEMPAAILRPHLWGKFVGRTFAVADLAACRRHRRQAAPRVGGNQTPEAISTGETQWRRDAGGLFGERERRLPAQRKIVQPS